MATLEMKARLAVLLQAAVANDTNFSSRARLVTAAMAAAAECGYPTGYRIDPLEPEWPVAFIELPTGQISWHMPQFPNPWDGHTASEKMDRIDRYLGAWVEEAGILNKWRQ